jgi:integrase
MKFRGEYDLYARKTVKGKKIYYYRLHDEFGNRKSGKSTGQASRSAAHSWMREQLNKELIITGRDLTFGRYAENWWQWDSCSYIEKELSKGRRLSRDYADTNRSYLDNNILPYFKKMHLTSMSPGKIESWMLLLVKDRKPTLSTTTVNHCLTTLNIMLREAVWNGYLSINPAENIRRLGTSHKKKSILKDKEVRALFNPVKIKYIWGDNIFHYTLNLLAASTGMRMGEIQSIRFMDIGKDYIQVRHSWSRKYGLKEPKFGSVREIGIPSGVVENLEKVIILHSNMDEERFLFSVPGTDVPIGNKQISNALYRAMDMIGISEDKRIERNITFHSWRYFLNTKMRLARIPDSKIRLVTGHKSGEMTNHYTKYRAEDFRDVAEVQNTFMEELNIKNPA